MYDRRPSHPIQKDPGGGSVEKCGDPIPNLAWEPLLEKLENKLPLDRIEGLPDVQLE